MASMKLSVKSCPLRGFLLAVKFLTRLPSPEVADFHASDLPRSAVWFPAVGALIGLILLLAQSIAGMLGPSVGALAVLIAWVWVTGALHIDGLADVADAMGAAHRDPERFLSVLRDPHIGTFGVIAVVLVLLTKLILLLELSKTAPVWPLILVPAWARLGVLVVSFAVPPLAAGSGERFRWEISQRMIAGNGILLVAASLYLAPALLFAVLIIFGVVLYWQRKLGGVTGDCLGASIEVIETSLLLVLVCAKAVAG